MQKCKKMLTVSQSSRCCRCTCRFPCQSVSQFPDGAGEPPRNSRAFRQAAVPCGDAEKGDVAGVSVEIELEQRAFEVWSNKAWPV